VLHELLAAKQKKMADPVHVEWLASLDDWCPRLLAILGPAPLPSGDIDLLWKGSVNLFSATPDPVSEWRVQGLE
jgi:hypothetical protein